MIVAYDSNNSGGEWWLEDEHWYALERAGWKVAWIKDEPPSIFSSFSPNGRWLGALATRATREGLSLGDAIAEWERVTGLSSAELGCYLCCGPPHSFSFEDNGKFEYYSPEAPLEGSRYE